MNEPLKVFTDNHLGQGFAILRRILPTGLIGLLYGLVQRVLLVLSLLVGLSSILEFGRCSFAFIFGLTGKLQLATEVVDFRGKGNNTMLFV